MRFETFVQFSFNSFAKSPILSDDSFEIYLYMDWHSRVTYVFEVFATNISKTSPGFEFDFYHIHPPNVSAEQELPGATEDPLVVLSLVPNKEVQHKVSCSILQFHVL